MILVQEIIKPVSLVKGTHTIAMQWEDRFYSVGDETSGAQVDLDFYMVDQSGNAILGFNRNNLNGDPLEIMPFVVQSSVEAKLIVIRRSGLTKRPLQIHPLFRGDGSLADNNQGISTDHPARPMRPVPSPGLLFTRTRLRMA